jgi:hypothetical protein
MLRDATGMPEELRKVHIEREKTRKLIWGYKVI